MSDFNDIAARYIAAWNETDAAARTALIADLYAEDASYIDPMVAAEGRDAIDATIGAVQGQFPGFRFSLAGEVDAHHEQGRLTWELGTGEGEAPVVGFDVIVLAADGRISKVYGFLDRVPAM